MENIFYRAQHLSEVDLLKTYIHLERYVNDGSPSGFDLNILSDFSPFSKKKCFNLPVFIDNALNHIQVGSLPYGWPEKILQNNEIPILIHPAVFEKIVDTCTFIKNLKHVTIEVQPTSSGRTVLWYEQPNNAHFIKLHFPEVIGRFNRDLSLYKWLSTIERSRELHIHANNFPLCLGYLYDFGGIYVRNEDAGYGFGIIFRGIEPIPKTAAVRKLLIPSFSLFAKTKMENRKIPLLFDLLNIIGTDSNKFFEFLLLPLLDSYFHLAVKIGFIPECNAQNILFEFDLESFKPRIILRDVGDVFVDYDIRKKNNMHLNFCTYKTLNPNKDRDIIERRSFAFDFKLSHYVLKPLIELFSEKTNIKFSSVSDIVKEYIRFKCRDNMEYFGSDKYWFAYPPEKNVGRYSYLRKENPIFR